MAGDREHQGGGDEKDNGEEPVLFHESMLLCLTKVRTIRQKSKASPIIPDGHLWSRPGRRLRFDQEMHDGVARAAATPTEDGILSSLFFRKDSPAPFPRTLIPAFGRVKKGLKRRILHPAEFPRSLPFEPVDSGILAALPGQAASFQRVLGLDV